MTRLSTTKKLPNKTARLEVETKRLQSELVKVRIEVTNRNQQEQEKLMQLTSNYKVLDIIGEGSMGTILKVYNNKLKRVEALKRLKIESKENNKQVARFRREAQAVSRLKRNSRRLSIPEVFGFAEGEKIFFYTMEFIEGNCLVDLILQHKLAPRQILEITRDLATILNTIHKNGILHRDIKPSNIILDKSGRSWLVDFGIIKELGDESVPLTSLGTVVGTPLYVAPERFLAENAPDPRSDIYSLGAVLYEMLTFSPLIQAETLDKVLELIVNSTPTPPSEQVAWVDDTLDRICLRALKKKPELRYSDAGEMLQDLEMYLEINGDQLPEKVDIAELHRAKVSGKMKKTVVMGRKAKKTKSSFVLVVLIVLAVATISLLCYLLFQE